MAFDPGFGLGFGLGLDLDLDPEPAHVVGTGGAIGAVLRHWVYTQVANAGKDRAFPTATLTVNVVGSFVFAVAVFAGWGDSTIQFLGIGICGSFTTFSSFSVETVQLWETGNRRLAVAAAGGNLCLSLVAIGVAWALASVLF
ncbi:fluoride efflux transporter CrcB [Halobacteria archaeon AArc-m2/3/4]|uniref:Fluoride-specific ion channel FluC n=1 Tax=Natronoglomus mannanivorans TaxID=2979990 RepID=A0AAP3E123_9EURY|nr:fluoride efflux transporter CrcB [Halobacteria archaeon AArc-xg1-1]MCU4973657.1 fluoride efflux transporter CrcB [Halobacteria archaeon AArc-m2/3/4]